MDSEVALGLPKQGDPALALADLTDPAAVAAAIAEFDRLGRERFLQTYGFHEARHYFLRSAAGNLYDSKAIAGVAHGYQFPAAGPLAAAEFVGGEATVRRKLESLGYEIAVLDTAVRNPPWTRDELILALDCYMRHEGSPPRSSPDLDRISLLLNRYHQLQRTQKADTLRNVNGVYMKIMNFRRFDPAYVEAGRSGLRRGNKLEEEVWRTFEGDPPYLGRVALAIERQLTGAELLPGFIADQYDEVEAPEGRILSRLHRFRERCRELVRAKKKQTIARAGVLRCEVCSFSFAAFYGERGEGFIECHHLKPVETLTESNQTKLSDLALLCANCHRMIHARRPWLSVRELKDLLIV